MKRISIAGSEFGVILQNPSIEAAVEGI